MAHHCRMEWYFLINRLRTSLTPSRSSDIRLTYCGLGLQCRFARGSSTTANPSFSNNGLDTREGMSVSGDSATDSGSNWIDTGGKIALSVGIVIFIAGASYLTGGAATPHALSVGTAALAGLWAPPPGVSGRGRDFEF